MEKFGTLVAAYDRFEFADFTGFKPVYTKRLASGEDVTLLRIRFRLRHATGAVQAVAFRAADAMLGISDPEVVSAWERCGEPTARAEEVSVNLPPPYEKEADSAALGLGQGAEA